MSTTARVSAGAGDGSRAGPDDVASPGEVAWLLLVPTLLVGMPLVLLLAAPLGRLAFPDPGYHFWVANLAVRKPAVQAGYALAVTLAIAYAIAVALVAQRRPRVPRALRAYGPLVVQVALLAFAIVCCVAQGRLDVKGVTRVYFTLPTLVVAAALALLTWPLARGGGPQALAPALARLGASSRALRIGCLAAALLLTAVWLLPTIYTEGGLVFAPNELYANAFAFDETSAVLDHRSPLVDMVAYSTLWPYVVALPLAAFGGGYLAFTLLMALLTGLGLLAVYGVLRRIVAPLPALVLYLPFLASGFFLERGTGLARYDPGTYFGMFPLRYAGPYLLAWLVARSVDQRPARRVPPELLFAAAGLVALNNVDFGFSALAATVLALLAAPRPGESLRRLLRGLAVGLAAALALVSLLTLLRAGSLPHLGLLTRYGRIFVNAGFSNLPLPALGLHVVTTLTFVAALATAAARRAAQRGDVVLTAMLAWSGVFGLGASVYFYAYRSHPDVLINLFSIWSLTLALLVVVTVRALRASERAWPTLPQLAVLFAFGVAVCSLAQLPLPWDQADRLSVQSPVQLFRMPELTAQVVAHTRPGERVAIFTPVGHRVAADAGVVNVSPYTGLVQMPAREQLDEVLRLLRRAGGTKVFVSDPLLYDGVAPIVRRHYRRVQVWPGIGWSGQPATLLEAQPAP